MIDILFEQRVVQNTGLAAEAIWHAVNEAYETSGRTVGVPLPLVFVVLPLVFHQRSAVALASKTQPGALYKALADDREITVGLQGRMEGMADRTLGALSVGFESGLLLVDTDHERQVIPGRKTAPVSHITDEVRTILSAAKRIGQALGELTVVQLAVHLNIRF
jgi:hypothetical protein